MFDNECFFVAPIGDDGSDIRKRSDGILKFVVGRAAQELELEAVRADNISKPGQITLQVIQHVMEAKAVVADLTGLNANVFYELAIRHAVKKPVVLIAEKGTKLPFDIAQLRTIFLDSSDLNSADKCRADIVAHLKESFDEPSADSPMATVIDIEALRSGDILEKNVAELIGAVGEVTQLSRQNADLIERMYVDGRRNEISPLALDDLLIATAKIREMHDSGDVSADLSDQIDRLERATFHVENAVRRRHRSARRIRELRRWSDEPPSAAKADE